MNPGKLLVSTVLILMLWVTTAVATVTARTEAYVITLAPKVANLQFPSVRVINPAPWNKDHVRETKRIIAGLEKAGLKEIRPEELLTVDCVLRISAKETEPSCFMYGKVPSPKGSMLSCSLDPVPIPNANVVQVLTNYYRGGCVLQGVIPADFPISQK